MHLSRNIGFGFILLTCIVITIAILVVCLTAPKQGMLMLHIFSLFKENYLTLQ